MTKTFLDRLRLHDDSFGQVGPFLVRARLQYFARRLDSGPRSNEMNPRLSLSALTLGSIKACQPSIGIHATKTVDFRFVDWLLSQAAVAATSSSLHRAKNSSKVKEIASASSSPHLAK